MKALSFVALFLSFAFFANAQETSDKTLVKTLDPQEATSLTIDFKTAQINPQPWDGQAFHVELIIKANMPIQVLEQLVKAGRYSIEGAKEGDQYFVTAPNMGKTVSVRGKDLEEEIIVNIKTPGNFALANNTLAKDVTNLAARGENDAKVKEFMRITNKVEIPAVSLQSTMKTNADLKLKTGDIVIDGIPVEIK